MLPEAQGVDAGEVIHLTPPVTQLGQLGLARIQTLSCKSFFWLHIETKNYNCNIENRFPKEPLC
ncbi:hypothetical protein I7I50_10109 [Histoplasma capsulatum G186AR]|uniref:Uncharacterized protein n=1 Tax=Ajellomyces capsulatus TaxID=5037 RepID=A0A8H8D717_AJECA|nr:hypothetical protein I7I52_01347 [Histoplasma capsulatum]QSS68962.1 hypothetical protein I7I50_10109 [Histoplasma capsulatum G186AR]